VWWHHTDVGCTANILETLTFQVFKVNQMEGFPPLVDLY
jgi:hypothetical protein